MIIDAHHHFWQYDPLKDNWIDDRMGVIRRDFLPHDLQPILEQNKVAGTVAVQATPSEAETIFLLTLADQNSFIKGVVGWVDLQADNCTERLEYFSKNHKLKGIRHTVQNEPDGFLLRKSFKAGISKLKDFQLCYDLLIYPHQLRDAMTLVAQFPDQTFIVDHIAKPQIKAREITRWEQDIRMLGEFENVHCKISGMVTEADWKDWQYRDLTPYLDIVFETFGVRRTLFGSDWPVCLLASDYQAVISTLKRYISQFSEMDQSRILARNAMKIYNLT